MGRAKRYTVQSRNIRFANTLGDQMNDSPRNSARPAGIQSNEEQASQGVDNSKDDGENGASRFGISLLMVAVSGFLCAVLM